VIIATTLVWVMDALLVHRIEAHHRVAHTFNPLLSSLERISTLAFIIVTVGLAISLYRSRHQHLFVWSLTYLVISMVQVVANVMAMVMTSSAVKGGWTGQSVGRGSSVYGKRDRVHVHLYFP